MTEQIILFLARNCNATPQQAMDFLILVWLVIVGGTLLFSIVWAFALLSLVSNASDAPGAVSRYLTELRKQIRKP